MLKFFKKKQTEAELQQVLKEEEEHIITPGQQAWKRLNNNTPAMVGMGIIILSVLIALFGYLITPDSTPNANDMVLQIGTKPPGFSIQMLRVRKNKREEPSFFLKTMVVGRENSYKLVPIIDYKFEGQYVIAEEYIGEEGMGRNQRYNLADVVYAKSINKTEVQKAGDKLLFTGFEEEPLSVPIAELREQVEKKHITTKTYFLGTDKFGRDILSRLLIGVRVSLSVGFIAVLISLFIGITMGAMAGFFRGRVDDIIMWFINVIWSIPTLLLVFAITLALGKGFWQIFVAVGLTMWVEVARLIRGQVMSIRETEFVEAARALGFSYFRTILRHILPNVMGPVMVIAAANFAAAILIEAGLSFLGIGVQPPTPSWGAMMKEHYGFIILDDPFLAIIPGLAIMIMVLSFNLLGNGFRDALDVKTKLSY